MTLESVTQRVRPVELNVKSFVAERLLARNLVSREFFDREADRLAVTCGEMARRFARGGRLVAFGRGASATDAQHVAVEFMHPIIPGNRILPALDLSFCFLHGVTTVVGEHDIVMGFLPPDGDAAITLTLQQARKRGAFTLALPGADADAAFDAPSHDPFVAQEVIEVLYHSLWETVHLFLEAYDRRGGDASRAAQPGLNGNGGETRTADILTTVASAIRGRSQYDERLRIDVVRNEGERIAEAISATLARIHAGATLFVFGNGGSATDANDWVIDCISAPHRQAVRAVSLSMDPATLTALGNDLGRDAMFRQQITAYGRPGDVAIAISTSGDSTNIIAALAEARRRNMLTIALLGGEGGTIATSRLADIPIVVRCQHVPRVQEVQASIYHVMTEAWRLSRQ
jgi:D-sedoheptulose 7-phosphate isomerase